MPPATPPAAAERFALLIEGLCRAVAARGGGRDRLAGPLVVLIWSRLRRLGVRFAALAARIAAGRQRRILARRPPRPAPRRPAQRLLPHGPAWLLRLVPQASAYGSLLQYLLAEPEMAALLAAAPQMGRLLRPLCRMLAVRPPAILRPPPPARAPASPPAASVQPLATAPRRNLPACTPPACTPPACGPPLPA